jgi:hypothetical protein
MGFTDTLEPQFQARFGTVRDPLWTSEPKKPLQRNIFCTEYDQGADMLPTFPHLGEGIDELEGVHCAPCGRSITAAFVAGPRGAGREAILNRDASGYPPIGSRCVHRRNAATGLDRRSTLWWPCPDSNGVGWLGSMMW